MESKLTAVQWLQEAISKKLSSEIGPYFLDLFDQAKAMERQQIKEAFKHGELPPLFVDFDAEQYYTHTFTEQPKQ
jgi:hypothetical protein